MTASIVAQRQPKVTKYETPKYPQYATAVWARGEVVVDVRIDANGSVVSATVESGHVMLKKPSEDAARQWKFAPSGEDHRKVKLVFVYNLKENKAFKNNYRKSKFKYKFKKPYTLETQVMIYPRIDI